MISGNPDSLIGSLNLKLGYSYFFTLRNFRHLGRNPFICDCNLEWLANYLTKNPIETSGARCERPRRMERKKLGGTKHTKFKCKGDFNLCTLSLSSPKHSLSGVSVSYCFLVTITTGMAASKGLLSCWSLFSMCLVYRKD